MSGDTPITLPRIKGMAFHSVLSLLRKKYGLYYLVQDDMMLWTTKEVAESEENLVRKVYPVGDLVVPIRNLGGGMMGGGMMGGMGGGMMGGGMGGGMMGGMGGGMMGGGMGGGMFSRRPLPVSPNHRGRSLRSSSRGRAPKSPWLCSRSGARLLRLIECGQPILGGSTISAAHGLSSYSATMPS